MHELRKLYYEIASSTSPSSLAALLNLVPPQQLLFGTDYPFAKPATVIEQLAEFQLSNDSRQAIDRLNAERLLPRFKG
jgi:6-methylsalicylate decarboxylase